MTVMTELWDEDGLAAIVRVDDDGRAVVEDDAKNVALLLDNMRIGTMEMNEQGELAMHDWTPDDGEEYVRALPIALSNTSRIHAVLIEDEEEA